MANSFNTSLVFGLLIFCGTLKAQLLSKAELDTTHTYISLEKALSEPNKVIKLDLRRQKLTKFPKDILKLQNLQSLCLRANKLDDFPIGISALTNLQELDISKNKIDTVYAELGKLVNLVYLNMNNNELSTLPKEIGNLKKLETLDLWSNYISVFPEEMANLHALKVLDLRVISLNDEDHRYLFKLLPGAKIHLSHACNCNH